jgi:hypothetical protein
MQIGSESSSLLDEPYVEQTQKAGTLKNLVAEVLNSVLFGDTISVHNFLGSHRSFTTSEQVLTMLFSW